MEETAKCARSILDDCHNIQEAYVGGQIDAHEYLCDNIDGKMHCMVVINM